MTQQTTNEITNKTKIKNTLPNSFYYKTSTNSIKEPVLKTIDHSFENYRPISSLSFCAKLLEKLINVNTINKY